MPKGRTAYSSRAAGPLPARRQWGADGSPAFWDMLGAGPGADGGGIADKECGARVGCKKKAAQRGRRPIIFLYPFPYAASALRRSSTNAWNAALARRAPQGPARRTAARSAAKSPASPPNEGSKDARTKVAAVRRPGLVGMRACRSPAARAAGLLFCAGLGAGRAENGSWLPDARSRLSPRGRPDVAAVRAGSRARIGLLAAARPPRLRRTARRA